jgi:PadR family transcriptional regulator, regulatory protein PadR
MRMLTATEYLFLTSILINRNGSYSIDICRTAKAITKGCSVSVAMGSIYPTLSRLSVDGLATSEMSAPTRVRGGRSRRIYSVTRSGIKAVKKFAMLIHQISAAHEMVEPGDLNSRNSNH